MKVAVIGASGRGGSRIVAELARRGHQVTAIARNPEKVEAAPNVTVRRGDLNEVGFPGLLAGHDAVVSAVRFANTDPDVLIGAVRKSGVERYRGHGRRRQSRSRARQAAARYAAISGRRQSRGRKRGVIFLDKLKAANGSRLGVPVAGGADRVRRAHRKIPARQGPVHDRRQRQESRSRSRIMRSRWSMNSSSTSIRANASPWRTEPHGHSRARKMISA